jgi:hypothetical protein
MAELNAVGLLPSTGDVGEWDRAIGRVEAAVRELRSAPAPQRGQPDAAGQLSDRLATERALLTVRRALDSRTFVATELQAGRLDAWDSAVKQLSAVYVPLGASTETSTWYRHGRGEFVNAAAAFIKAAKAMRPVLAARAAGTTPATQRLTGLLDRAAALANAESELDAPDLRVLGENEAVQAWEDAAHRGRTTVYAALAREFGITSETEPDGVAPSEAQRVGTAAASRGRRRSSGTVYRGGAGDAAGTRRARGRYRRGRAGGVHGTA